MCRLGSWSTRPEVKSAPKSALRHCTKISCAASDGDFCSIHPGAKTLVSLHICAGVVTGQAISIKISCADSEDSDESANLHRLA